ncbi:MAG: CHAP domain-containing protein [Clostridia bacterium]|nr:CHAP domain-containing protein [Clostridia bacterium]
MKQGLKRKLAFLLTLLLLLSAVPLNILTAQAFAVRTTKPSSKDSHYYSGANPFYAGGYLNECTWYAWGRAYEALGFKPNLSTAAAHCWYRYNTSQKACPYDTKPKAGSIMVTVKDGKHGHVAFVEELYKDGTMLISEYNYGVRSGFSTQVIKQLSAGERRGRAHKVLGYIYVIDSKPADKTAPTITALKVAEKTEEDFALAARAKDNVGVTAVKFKVRTADQDWQDGVWFDASRSENGGWTCRIPLSSFNDYRGQYVARCYAYDKAGNKKSDDINVSIKPVFDENDPAANQTSVRFPTWAAERTNDDAIWFDGACPSETGAWEQRTFGAALDPAAARGTETDACVSLPSSGVEVLSLCLEACADAVAADDSSFDFAQISAQNLYGWALNDAFGS